MSRAKQEPVCLPHQSVSAAKRQIEEQADQALLRMIEGEDIPADSDVLQTAGYSSYRDIQRGLFRMRRIKSRQDRAGTQVERDELRKAVSEADELALQRLPQLDEEIRRLELERKTISEAAAVPRERLAAMDRATEELQSAECLPPSTQSEFYALMRKTREASAAADRAKDLVERIRAVLADVDSGSESFTDPVTGIAKIVDADSVESLAQQLAEHEAELVEQSELQKAAKLEAAEMLKRYVV